MSINSIDIVSLPTIHFFLKKINNYEPSLIVYIKKYIYYKFKDRSELIEAINLYFIDTLNHTQIKYKYGDISLWDVSNITDFSELFSKDCEQINNSNFTSEQRKKYICEKFNSDISDWDVSNSVNMRNMFNNCVEFNCDLNRWDTSKVQNMNGMFFNCKKFNKNLNYWNVNNVINMEWMFAFCENFNRNLNSWNLNNVKYISYIFYDCRNLNQELNWDLKHINNDNKKGFFAYCLFMNFKKTFLNK